MIRISKKGHRLWGEVIVSGVECSYTNILKVIGQFLIDSPILVLDYPAANSKVLSVIRTQELEYRDDKSKSRNPSIFIKVSQHLIKDILEAAVAEDPENLLIINCPSNNKWMNDSYEEYQLLIREGLSDFMLHISSDENTIVISFSKRKYMLKEVCRKLKKAHLE